MNEDLQNEVEAINSIYGDGSLVASTGDSVYILQLPQQAFSLRLRFPLDYPSSPPSILGSQSSGEHARKGEASELVAGFRDAVGKLFQPGEVCLFDAIEDINSRLASLEEHDEPNRAQTDFKGAAEPQSEADHPIKLGKAPPWALSDVVIESKSVFVARSASVSSTDQAKQYLQHLLDSDKKIRSATHNITAWRIKGENDVTYQDCDDDGETAAGGRVLHLMQLMELWNVMVVVTRWYRGHQLGPKRFSIISTVARDAFVKGGFVADDTKTSKKKAKG